MQSDLAGKLSSRGGAACPSPCAVCQGKLGWLCAPKVLQVKDFACREKPSRTDMWLEQVSTAGLSTEGCVQAYILPFRNRIVSFYKQGNKACN